MSARRQPPVDSAVRRAERLAGLFAETAADHDRDGSFPFANFERLAEADLLALRTPALLGGGGAGLREAADVIGTIAQGEPATALVLAMQYLQHAAMSRDARWPAHLKERLARDATSGVSLINALRVEPDLGTPARGGLPATTAVRVGTEWRLSGRKIYSTGAPILAWYAVWAKTDEFEPRVGTFLVPAGLPGIRIIETWDHVGLRASGSHDVVFENVAVPLDHAVDIRPRKEWSPGEALHHHLENAVLVGALYNGIAVAARNWLVAFLGERVPSNLGHPLSELPRVQESVGAIELKLRTSARLIESLASDVDAALLPPASDAFAVKSVVTNNTIEAIEIALTLAGNHGLSRHNPLQRHYRDALCGRVHTPQDDFVKTTLGRAAVSRSNGEAA